MDPKYYGSFLFRLGAFQQEQLFGRSNLEEVRATSS
jgi:hypothetical protein